VPGIELRSLHSGNTLDEDSWFLHLLWVPSIALSGLWKVSGTVQSLMAKESVFWQSCQESEDFFHTTPKLNSGTGVSPSWVAEQPGKDVNLNSEHRTCQPRLHLECVAPIRKTSLTGPDANEFQKPTVKQGTVSLEKSSWDPQRATDRTLTAALSAKEDWQWRPTQGWSGRRSLSGGRNPSTKRS
jgi:hypothetical protein